MSIVQDFVESKNQKFCANCIYYISTSTNDWCCGPHVKRSPVTGKRLMTLPGARYSGGDGLESGTLPCGEIEARHFKQIPEPTFKERNHGWINLAWAALVTVLIVGIVYLIGVIHHGSRII